MKGILKFEPIQKFIKTIGKDVEKYFGKDPGCIIYLKPDGAFYGTALYQWLKPKNKKIILTTMEDDGEGLEEEKVRGRKVLIVDNEIVTGKAYKRSMEAIRIRKERLGIRDLKFASYIDRVGLANFSVWRYSSEAIWHPDELDALDLKIISYLAKNGRKSFAEIGKELRLSPVAVKNRLSKLLKEKILKIQGALNINQFYTISAQIQIEADEKTIPRLIEKFEKSAEVYHIVRVSGRYNLILGILAHNLENIEELIENEIRSLPGVKQIDVLMGDLPLTPKTIPPRFD